MRASLVLLVVAVAAVPLAVALAGPRRSGRVVRVERPRKSAPEQVRLCMVTSPEEGKMMCYGAEPPDVGSLMTLIDDAGIRGRAAVRETGPSAFDQCKLGSAHDVVVEPEAGRGTLSPQVTSYVVALQGVTLDDSARLVSNPQLTSPSRRPMDQVWVAVDRNGDGAPDLLTVVAECSQEVQVVPRAPAGQRVTPYCIDYWVEDGSDWTRAGRDLFYQCM